jgi:hypothetical protein
MALVAGVTLGITTLLGLTFEYSEPNPAEGIQTDHAPTPVQGGDAGQGPALSICVQAIGVDTSIEAIAKARIETAMVDVMRHPLWNLSEPPPLVDIGCPEEPLPARPGIAWKDAEIIGGTGTIYTVSEPGFYSEYVFIMPLERIDALLGGLSIRVAPQEYVGYGDELIAERGSATYIAPEELEDVAFLTKQLTIAVGLEDRYPEPSPE